MILMKKNGIFNYELKEYKTSERNKYTHQDRTLAIIFLYDMMDKKDWFYLLDQFPKHAKEYICSKLPMCHDSRDYYLHINQRLKYN